MTVKAGDVIRIAEADYAYGLGALTLRVTHVDPNPHPNLEWLRIKGTEIRWDGTDGKDRDVLVRVSGLRSRRHRPRETGDWARWIVRHAGKAIVRRTGHPRRRRPPAGRAGPVDGIPRDWSAGGPPPSPAPTHPRSSTGR